MWRCMTGRRESKGQEEGRAPDTRQHTMVQRLSVESRRGLEIPREEESVKTARWR
jgi:hypothetical protein